MIARVLSAAALLLAAPARAEPAHSWQFSVFLDNAEIGTHRFDLYDRNGEWELHSHARFDVKLLRLTVYRYRHDAVERWHGDCLVSLESQTDDNGETQAVRAARGSDGLLLFSGDAPATPVPGCAQSFAYWNPGFRTARRLIHPQTGKVVEVEIRRAGTETITVEGQPLEAVRYELRGSGISIDLWYSRDDVWLALETRLESGRRLHYALLQLPAKEPRSLSGSRQGERS
jgi:hypothetical protein